MVSQSNVQFQPSVHSLFSAYENDYVALFFFTVSIRNIRFLSTKSESNTPQRRSSQYTLQTVPKIKRLKTSAAKELRERSSEKWNENSL